MKWSAGAMNRDVTNRDGPQRAGMTAISPAAAQIAPAQITPEIDRQMWCGVAFSVVASEATRSNRSADAKTAGDRSRWLLAKAAEVLLLGPEQSAKDFQDLVAAYTTRVVAPFAPPEVAEADCISLATTARPQ